MQMLSHDPSAALEAWNAELPDTTGSIWHEQDAYVTDASYYGHVDWDT